MEPWAFAGVEITGGTEVIVTPSAATSEERERMERRQLVMAALQEDRDRTAARLVRERERQRTTEAEKSARLRELRLAKEAAEAQLNTKEKPLR